MPYKEDMFQRIVNVGWGGSPDEYVIFTAGAYSLDGDITTASVTIGSGPNQITVPILDGLLNKSTSSPLSGPAVVPVVALPNWHLTYTAGLREYNFIAFTQPMIAPDFANGEPNNGGVTTLLFVRTQRLRELFGSVVPFTIDFTLSDFSSASMIYRFFGLVCNLPALPGIDVTFDEELPQIFIPSSGPNSVAGFVIDTAVGGEGLVPNPPSQFVGSLNLTNHTVADLTPYL